MQPEQSQTFLRKLTRVALATLRIFLRRNTWVKIFRAVDFLLSNEMYTYASAIAFNVLIAFFPAAIIVLTIINHIGGPGLHNAALNAIIDYIPTNQAFFRGQLAAVSQHFTGMTLLSLVILLFSAVGIFVPVELALNYIWKVKEARHWTISQFISFGLLFLFALMAIIPVGISWMCSSTLDVILFFLKDTPFLNAVEWLIMKIVTLPFTIIAFSIAYTVLPLRKMKMEEVIPASFFTGIVCEAGKYLYVLVLPVLGFREVYGAFTVSVTFITWALFAAMMLLMGSYLTHEELLPKIRVGGGKLFDVEWSMLG